jgi:hypothetical protein
MDIHFFKKKIKNYCCECYLHCITCSLNFILKMMNYYDETNMIPFDERTRIKFISFEVIQKQP